MANPSERRLQKELTKLIKDPPPGVSIDPALVGDKFNKWIVSLDGPPNSLYQGQRFQLQFRFSATYPFESPEVMFVAPDVPVHPHIYSNGHICLSILTDDWSPALSVQSVCLSIISMLSSCKDKRFPIDNSLYVKTCSRNPKDSRWWFHDDSV